MKHSTADEAASSMNATRARRDRQRVDPVSWEQLRQIEQQSFVGAQSLQIGNEAFQLSDGQFGEVSVLAGERFIVMLQSVKDAIKGAGGQRARVPPTGGPTARLTPSLNPEMHQPYRPRSIVASGPDHRGVHFEPVTRTEGIERHLARLRGAEWPVT